MHDDISEVLFSEEAIADRVGSLGAAIARDYTSDKPLIVGVLNGCFPFVADLVRAIDIHVEVDFIAVSSYGSGTKSSGVVRTLKVIAGTGLGHVNKLVYPALKRARDAGVQMYMTLQTLWGFVQMHVYETGREILELGVVPLANMLPEVAYMKLGWALGLHPNDPAAVRRTMTTPIADEMTDGEPPDGYLVFQGGVPEMEKLLDKIWW